MVRRQQTSEGGIPSLSIVSCRIYRITAVVVIAAVSRVSKTWPRVFELLCCCVNEAARLTKAHVV